MTLRAAKDLPMSFAPSQELENCLEGIRERLAHSATLTLPLEEELKLLDGLTQFEFGRFLLKHRMISGYWTHYMILPPLTSKSRHPLETWMLTEAPVICATRERYALFRHWIQSYLRSGMVLASVPCGMMDDLLTLNYTRIDNFTLVGIDKDENVLKLAEENAHFHGLAQKTKFYHGDAWQLNHTEAFDVLTSNGLNIYESDRARLIELYAQMWTALKPEGWLITSFLTPPPQIDPLSPWRNIDPRALRLQQALLVDIVQHVTLNFCNEPQMRSILEDAGFNVKLVLYDRRAMMPAIIAQKPKAV